MTEHDILLAVQRQVAGLVACAHGLRSPARLPGEQ